MQAVKLAVVYWAVFQDVLTVNGAGLKSLDLTGVEQLNDAFFVVVQFFHRDSALCRNLESLTLVGCTHITDLSAVYITQLFPNLKKASLFLLGMYKLTIIRAIDR